MSARRTIEVHLWPDGAYAGRLNEFRQDNAAAEASGDYRPLERHARSIADQWAVRVIDSVKDAKLLPQLVPAEPSRVIVRDGDGAITESYEKIIVTQ